MGLAIYNKKLYSYEWTADWTLNAQGYPSPIYETPVDERGVVVWLKDGPVKLMHSQDDGYYDSSDWLTGFSLDTIFIMSRTAYDVPPPVIAVEEPDNEPVIQAESVEQSFAIVEEQTTITHPEPDVVEESTTIEYASDVKTYSFESPEPVITSSVVTITSTSQTITLDTIPEATITSSSSSVWIPQRHESSDRGEQSEPVPEPVPLIGDDKANILTGSDDNDIIRGLGGNDEIRGMGGDDTLYGDDNNDRLYGESGNDRLYGGDGNDKLYGGTGNDILDGGYRYDEAVFNYSAATTNLTLDLSDTTRWKENADGTWASGTGVGYEYQRLAAGDETDYFKNIERFEITAGAGNDVLTGGAGRDFIYGEAGNDTLYGGAGKDRLYGGDGDDVLDGGTGHDTLYGGAGNDVLYSQIGHDFLVGGAGDDILDGGAGDNGFIGGAGNDILDGNAGDDTALFAYWDATSDLTLDATDTMRWKLDGTSADVGDSDYADYEYQRLQVDDETDYFKNIENLRLYAGAGNDALTGEAGNDLLYGGAGDDILDGGAGDDFIDGGIDNDQLNGGNNNDWLIGGDGDDTLYGGVGDDRLRGNDGNDTLYGGSGHDSLMGGDGDDSFVLNLEGTNEDLDTVSFFWHRESGEDKIRVDTTNGNETTLDALKTAANIRWEIAHFTDNPGRLNNKWVMDTIIYSTNGTADTSDDFALMVLEDYATALTIADFDIV